MTYHLHILRVANGWVIQPGSAVTHNTNEFTHVAKTPEELADHLLRWAKAQADEADE